MNVMNKVNFDAEFILIIWFGVLIVFNQGQPPEHVGDFESLVKELQRVENVVLFEELLHKIKPKDISEMRKSNVKKKEWQDKLEEYKKNTIDHEAFYDYLHKEFDELEKRFNVVKKIVDASSAAQDIYIRGLFKTLAQSLKDKIAKVKQDEEEERRKIQEEKDRKAKEDAAKQAQQNVTSTTPTSTTTTTQMTQQVQTAQVPSQEKTEENCLLRLLDWIKKVAEFKFGILRAKLDFLRKKFSFNNKSRDMK